MADDAPDAPRATTSSHASLDVGRRREKARKITTLLERRRALENARVLDIGTGAGVIAQFLGDTVGPGGHADSVDVRDARVVDDSYDFHLIESTTLPFAAGAFDVVVSNHVIEHVGGRPEQLDHLREIRRVLAPDGIGYVAFPNRFGPVEPHFRLPGLGWLPPGAQDAYVRATKRGSRYDCRLLTWRDFDDLATTAELAVDDVTIEAMRVLGQEESVSVPVKVLTRAPSSVVRALHGAVPTFVALVRTPRSD